jgi:hypothetical protein
LKEAQPDQTDLTFHKLDRKTANAFLEYDQNLSIIDRQTYLEYLFTIKDVSSKKPDITRLISIEAKLWRIFEGARFRSYLLKNPE